MRKSIALLRTPKGSPLPIKFMVLFNKANPKDLRLYLGPKPESGLAKLKTQFPPEVKVNRVKDPKGKVVWEKAALTFLSDILKAGLAKQIQLSIRQQTKVTVKVRIKRSDGAVDEADAKDVSDDELKVSPAEEAEMLAAGQAFEARLKELDGAIQAALKGPNAAKVKAMVAAIQSAGKSEKFDAASDGLDELESLLEEGDVAESDGKDLQADAAGPGDKGVASGQGPEGQARSARSKIKEAIAARTTRPSRSSTPRKRREQLLQKEARTTSTTPPCSSTRSSRCSARRPLRPCRSPSWRPRGATGSSRGTRRSRRSPISRRPSRSRSPARRRRRRPSPKPSASSASCRSSCRPASTTS